MNNQVINALRVEQTRLAIDSMKRSRTANTDSAIAYEYGYSVGVYAGFDRAIERVLALYRDDKEDTFA